MKKVFSSLILFLILWLSTAFATDTADTYIYYDNASDSDKIYKKNANDWSDGSAIISDANSTPFALSPDWNYLVYSNSTKWFHLYKKNTSDSLIWTQITSATYAEYPSYSSDWNYIFYVNGSDGYKIYKKNANDWSDGSVYFDTESIWYSNPEWLAVCNNWDIVTTWRASPTSPGYIIRYDWTTANVLSNVNHWYLYLNCSSDSSKIFATTAITNNIVYFINSNTPQLEKYIFTLPNNAGFWLNSNTTQMVYSGYPMWLKDPYNSSTWIAITSAYWLFPSFSKWWSGGGGTSGSFINQQGYACTNTNYPTGFVNTPYSIPTDFSIAPKIASNSTCQSLWIFQYWCNTDTINNWFLYTFTGSNIAWTFNYSSLWATGTTSHLDHHTMLWLDSWYISTIDGTTTENIYTGTHHYATNLNIKGTTDGSLMPINYVEFSFPSTPPFLSESTATKVVANAYFIDAYGNDETLVPMVFSGGYALAVAPTTARSVKIEFWRTILGISGMEVWFFTAGTTTLTNCSIWSLACNFTVTGANQFSCLATNPNVQNWQNQPLPLDSSYCEVVNSTECQPTSTGASAAQVWGSGGLYIQTNLWTVSTDPIYALSGTINSWSVIGTQYTGTGIFDCSIDNNNVFSALQYLGCPFTIMSRIWAQFTSFINTVMNLWDAFLNIGKSWKQNNNPLTWFLFDTAYADATNYLWKSSVPFWNKDTSGNTIDYLTWANNV